MDISPHIEPKEFEQICGLILEPMASSTFSGLGNQAATKDAIS